MRPIEFIARATLRVIPRGLRLLRLTALILLAAGLSLTTGSPDARAEGEAQLGGAAPLKQSTVMRIDILEDGETVTWNGVGNLNLTDMAGTPIESVADDATSGPLSVGTIVASLSADQRMTVGFDFFASVNWDITVSRDGVPQDGRLRSTKWVFTTGSFGAEKAADDSVYALLPGGVPGTDVVIEMQIAGLNGFEYQISGNRRGLVGANAGRSVKDPNFTVFVQEEYPIYLNVPQRANYGAVTPDVQNLRFEGSFQSCDTTVVGVPGTFTFETNVDGTFHLLCDFDRDGMFRRVGAGGDLLIIGEAQPPTGVTPGDFYPVNVIWDGFVNGTPVPALGPDTPYSCQVEVHVGEFHFAARDVETAFPGLRMFEVQADATSRVGLPMFWNDQQVQDQAVTLPLDPPVAPPMPINLQSPPFPPPFVGLDSGDYADPTLVYGLIPPYSQVPSIFRDGNSRAWGAFRDPATLPPDSLISKGEKSVLDTYTWARASVPGPVSFYIIEDVDTDMDGCSDLKEICVMGTEIDDQDTDDDNLLDCAEFEFNTVKTNPLLPDTDGDGLCDGNVEVFVTSLSQCIPGEDFNLNGENEQMPDMQPQTETLGNDEDTDNDGWCDGPKSPEGTTQCPPVDGVSGPGDNCPLTPNPDQADADMDGIGDACDLNCDPDGDGIIGDNIDPSLYPECFPESCNDIDGNPPTMPCATGQTECCVDNCDVANPGQEDLDEDGEGDICDCDIDNDTVNDKSYNQSSQDPPGLPDCWPTIPPTDPPPTDPCPDSVNELCIDNCPRTPNTSQVDGDDDGMGDACECDRDGDGIIDSSDPACWTDNPECVDNGNPPTAECTDGMTECCIDNCPDTPNPDQRDRDNDGLGDVCDCDRDGDGVIDSSDPACWTDNPECVDNGNPPTEACTDGMTECCIDNCANQANADQLDWDDDGIGDICDCDVDNDGIADKTYHNDPDLPECWPTIPPNDPPPSDPCPDSVNTLCLDNCTFTPNNGQEDIDNEVTRDAAGDACECDPDEDSVINLSTAVCWPDDPKDGPFPQDPCNDATDRCIDNCPDTANVDQADGDDDGEGDACECDRDGDGVRDNSARICWPDIPPEDPPPTTPCMDGQDDDTDLCLDNCPDDQNPGQENLDQRLQSAGADEFGDACDCDKDGDSVIDSRAEECWDPGPVPPDDCTGGDTVDCVDNCPVDPNTDQADCDSDSVGDVCDADDDNDGASDVDELAAGSDICNPDTDGGGERDGDELFPPPGTDQTPRDPTDPCDDLGADGMLLNSCQVLLQGSGGCSNAGGPMAPLALVLALGLLAWFARRRRGDQS